MSLLSSILLGLIQGLAEFLPISSSGHLAIAEHFLGQAGVPATPDFFDVLLHLGTLVAVFAAYWQDIRDMIVELIDGVRDLVRGTTPNPIPPARRMILLIIVGTLPLYEVLPVKAVAAVVGYICIRLLKMIADKGKFGWFAYYCWAVGLIVLALTLVLK